MNVGSTTNSAQLQQLLQSIFSTADTNGDGSLSSSEFQNIGQNVQAGGNSAPTGSLNTGDMLGALALSALLSQQQQSLSGQAAATSSIDARFAAADTNGDGSLSADELTAAMAKRAPNSAQATIADRSAKLLAAADTNGDGVLSKAEFAAIPHGHGGHHHGGGAGLAATTPAASGSGGTTYNAADTNKDGVVSAAELMASLSSVPASAGPDVSGDALTTLTKLLQQLGAPQTTGASVSASA